MSIRVELVALVMSGRAGLIGRNVLFLVELGSGPGHVIVLGLIVAMVRVPSENPAKCQAASPWLVGMSGANGHLAMAFNSNTGSDSVSNPKLVPVEDSVGKSGTVLLTG